MTELEDLKRVKYTPKRTIESCQRFTFAMGLVVFAIAMYFLFVFFFA